MPTKQPVKAKSTPKRKAQGTRQTKASTSKPKAPARPKDCISLKDQAFADLYRGGPPELRYNATACYKHLNPTCSYETARAEGCTLLAKPSIQAYLDAKRSEIADNADLTQEKILQAVGRVALADPRDLYDEVGRLRPVKDLPDEVALTIQSIKYKDGEPVEYRLADRGAALDKLMKWRGLYSEDNKQRSPLADLPPETLLELVARLGGGA